MKKEEPPTAKGSRNQPTRIPSTNQPRSSQNILIAFFKRFYDPIRRTNADFLLPSHTTPHGRVWCRRILTSHLQSANRTNVEDPRFKIRTSVRLAVWQFLPLYLPNPNCVIAPSAIPPFIDPLMDSSLLGIAKWNGFNAVSPRCWPRSKGAFLENQVRQESLPDPSLKSTLDRLRNFTRRAAPNIK